jgi:hypothetical protein
MTNSFGWLQKQRPQAQTGCSALKNIALFMRRMRLRDQTRLIFFLGLVVVAAVASPLNSNFDT